MNNFYWFTGLVKDVDDPLKIGRVRVLIHGKHSDIKNVDHVNGTGVNVNCLPWGIPIQSVVSSANNGIGISPTGYDIDTQVAGFAIDPLYENIFILGTIAGAPDGISDIPDCAKEEESTEIKNKKNSVTTGVSIAGGGSWSEPESQYNPKYPNNKVLYTSSGHMIEIDDTSGSERIHIYHKSGSSTEYHPNGDVVFRGENDLYSIIKSDQNISVKGSININASNCNIKTANSTYIDAGGDIFIKSAKFVKIEALSVDVKATTLNADISGSSTISSTGPTAISASSGFTITSPGAGLVSASSGLILKGAIKTVAL